MRTVKKTTTVAVLLTLLFATSTMFTYQAHATAPAYDLTGTWTWVYHFGGDWVHTMIIEEMDGSAFSGCGHYNSDPSFTWVVTGTVDGDQVSFTIDYTGSNPDYYVDANGAISSDGNSMSGDATAPGQTATWDATRATYTIEASVEGNGVIDPSGTVIVNSGADQTFTITPDVGYHIADVVVDSTDHEGPISSYTFYGVDADHEILAIFEVNIHLNLPPGVETAIAVVLPGDYDPMYALPGGTEPYFAVTIISGSFSGNVQVCVQYDDSLTPEQEQNLRLYMSDPVDFNHDGTIDGKDIALMQKAMKSGVYDPEFDVNHDGKVDKADFWIVQQYASKGLILNPGRDGVDKRVRLPWIDITTSINTVDNVICGETGWLSVFRAF